jgi:hypothetical protein
MRTIRPKKQFDVFVRASVGALSLFRRVDGSLLFKFPRGFDQSPRLVELHSQSDPGYLKGEKPFAGFWRACEPCKLRTTHRVLTTLFGIAGHLTASLVYSFPAETIGIDSKRGAFCQYGSRRGADDGRGKADGEQLRQAPGAIDPRIV